MASKNVYKDTAFGIAVFPHLNEPDAKFNPQSPLFKVGLRLKGAVAQKFKEEVDVAADAAFTAFMDDPEGGGKLKPKERAEWKTYRPYEEETTDEGDPLPDGPIVFDFKQNAKIKLRDGTIKDVTIGLYDADNNAMSKLIMGGSEIRVRYSLRAITMKSLKQVGVRLDFAMVQVRKLAERSAGGFGKVEGYVDDGAPEDSGGFGGSEQKGSGGSDY